MKQEKNFERIRFRSDPLASYNNKEEGGNRYMDLTPSEIENGRARLCIDHFFRLMASLIIDLETADTKGRFK
jgi:hypothetical protein